MRILDIIVAVLLVIGGANWGLVGVFDFNLVSWLTGDLSAASRIIYALVGLSALYQALQVKGIQRRWQWTEEPSTVWKS